MSEMTFEKLLAQYGGTIAQLADQEHLAPGITMAELAEMLTEGGAVFVTSPVTGELGEEMQAAATYLMDAARASEDWELSVFLGRAALHLDVVEALA